MRVVVIDPEISRILEIFPTFVNQAVWDGVVKGDAVFHPVVQDNLDDHYGYVNRDGILKRQKAWWFANTMIWGPMAIFTMSGDQERSCRASVEELRRHTQFSR